MEERKVNGYSDTVKQRSSRVDRKYGFASKMNLKNTYILA